MINSPVNHARQKWSVGDGCWFKQANAALIELIKRSPTAKHEGGFIMVYSENDTRLLDRGLYLPRE